MFYRLAGNAIGVLIIALAVILLVAGTYAIVSRLFGWAGC